ncbi:hypothetical protein GCM10027072_08720 [Streptomyces bullii]
MASGCRDCQTCTMSWIARMGRHTLYLFTLSWLVKPVFLKNCPQCKHMMGRHQRRRDGSFQD